MTIKINDFLAETSIHVRPIWNEFIINHIPPELDQDMRRVNKTIRTEFHDSNGVYVYTDKNDIVLYVGIGKLAERIRFHYYESFGKYSGKNCEKHIKFFTQFQGEIKILWTKIDNREDQKEIEMLLTHFLSPVYEDMKKKGLLY
ncbi:hypothetical protein [Paenibacillus silvisoli]|uniref:hypothetical protein n=1 Tax=Paenibacillus silvisoli TaxID=3110539 RepID=UPI00280391DC|nr:hypothetical protein [Paenibacillus silvisoli]